MVHATVIGARGYLGRELLRLLLLHPEIDKITPTSTTQAGSSYDETVPSLRGAGLTFETPDSDAALDADVLFTATPGGEAGRWTDLYEQHGVKSVIDLSRDHRHAGLQKEDGWVYGLADVTPVQKGAARIANPGCYPTASLLALAPAAKNGLIGDGPVIVDGKSGVSGAGVSPQPHLHFPEMNDTVQAYKVLGHDHEAEIAGCASNLRGQATPVRFTPHLVPLSRGLLATVYAPIAPGTEPDDVAAAYAAAYQDSAFTHFVQEANTGHVRGSNLAQVAVDVDTATGLLVARGAIDNLCKGGSGTAVQNMNDAFGFSSNTGLQMAGMHP